MILSDIAVKRPTVAVVLSLLLVVFGAVAFDRTSLRQYPDIDPPVVSIQTDYRGASADILDTKVTRVLEDQLSGLEGIKYISSVSRDGSSSITIEFEVWARLPRLIVALLLLPDQATCIITACNEQNAFAW